MNTNLGPIRLRPRGEFDPTIQYKFFDWVTYQGSSYVCINDDIIDGISNIGILPVGEQKSSIYWHLLAGKGQKGELADRYANFYDLEDNVWDYNITDKIFIGDNFDITKQIEIINAYDGCCGMILTKNGDILLPSNSSYNISFDYMTITKTQFYIYSFIYNEALDKFIWNRAVYYE